jgi:hypothetical protein
MRKKILRWSYKEVVMPTMLIFKGFAGIKKFLKNDFQ